MKLSLKCNYTSCPFKWCPPGFDSPKPGRDFRFVSRLKMNQWSTIYWTSNINFPNVASLSLIFNLFSIRPNKCGALLIIFWWQRRWLNELVYIKPTNGSLDMHQNIRTNEQLLFYQFTFCARIFDEAIVRAMVLALLWAIQMGTFRCAVRLFKIFCQVCTLQLLFLEAHTHTQKKRATNEKQRDKFRISNSFQVKNESHAWMKNEEKKPHTNIECYFMQIQHFIRSLSWIFMIHSNNSCHHLFIILSGDATMPSHRIHLRTFVRGVLRAYTQRAHFIYQKFHSKRDILWLTNVKW